MWRVAALLALASVSSAQEFGPCPAPPDVALTVEPVSRELSSSAAEVSVLVTGSVTEGPSCWLLGATLQMGAQRGAGFAAPLLTKEGNFSQVVTIPLPPPRRGRPTVLHFSAAAVNQAGTGYSAPAELILPRRP